MTIAELNKAIGNIDLFLLDQLLKGRYLENDTILDAGCGEGRNIVYFLQHNFDIYGIDKNPGAIEMLQFIARSNGKSPEKFCVGDLIALPYPANFFNHVIANAVLHFASDDKHFESMFSELIRVLKPSGSIFISMSSAMQRNPDSGFPKDKHIVPSNTEISYLLTKATLENVIEQHALTLIEPVKNLNEGRLKNTTTLMLSKPGN